MAALPAEQTAATRQADTNSHVAARYIDTVRQNPIPADSLDAAKMCLVDWMAVCLGARETPEAGILDTFIRRSGASGSVPLLIGGKSDALNAALINGALSHCLDYDDTHIPTALHASGPTWAAVLALGVELNAPEVDLLKAFVCGFEIGASFGSKGVGVRLNESGWHSTAVLGRLAAASASASLMQLDADATEHAFGLAATQAGGLTASFGTMAKPFHAGKAAMDGLLAAQLASAGLKASQDLLDSPKGLFGTIFQDGKTIPFLGGLGVTPEIMQNSLKPYAACQLTHSPIDAALKLRPLLGNAGVEAITVHVNPLAIEIAGVRDARTPTAGRFSTGFCIALALEGYPIAPGDFTPERLADPILIDLADRVSMVGSTDIARTAARLEAKLTDGSVVATEVEHAFGSVGNPMGWPQLESKFAALVEPVLGEQAAGLYDTLATFEQPGSFARCLAFINNLAALPTHR